MSNNLNLMKDENGVILNTKKIIDDIENGTYSLDELNNSLNLLQNRKDDFKNSDEIISRLQSKIFEKESRESNELQSVNKKGIERLKQLNPDLARLGVVSSDKLHTDSEKNIDYLILEDEKGNSTRMLAFGRGGEVEEFIASNPDAVNYDAERFYEHFSKWIVTEMTFRPLNDNAKNVLFFQTALGKKMPDKVSSILEEQEKQVKFYQKTNGFGNSIIKYAIDKNGELFYQVGPSIIKFHSVGEKRNMDILFQPNQYNKLNQSGVNSQYASDNANEINKEIVTTNYSVNQLHDSINDSSDYEVSEEEINKNKENEEKIIPIDDQNFNRANQILEQIQIGANVSNEDMAFVSSFSNEMVNAMKKTPEEFETMYNMSYQVYCDKLSGLIEFLKQGNIENSKPNTSNENPNSVDETKSDSSLTNFYSMSSNIINTYDANYKSFSNNLKIVRDDELNPNKQKVLLDNNKTQGGAIMLVIILEIVALCLIGILFLCIAIQK